MVDRGKEAFIIYITECRLELSGRALSGVGDKIYENKYPEPPRAAAAVLRTVPPKAPPSPPLSSALVKYKVRRARSPTATFIDRNLWLQQTQLSYKLLPPRTTQVKK